MEQTDQYYDPDAGGTDHWKMVPKTRADRHPHAAVTCPAWIRKACKTGDACAARHEEYLLADGGESA